MGTASDTGRREALTAYADLQRVCGRCHANHWLGLSQLLFVARKELGHWQLPKDQARRSNPDAAKRVHSRPSPFTKSVSTALQPSSLHVFSERVRKLSRPNPNPGSPLMHRRSGGVAAVHVDTTCRPVRRRTRATREIAVQIPSL